MPDKTRTEKAIQAALKAEAMKKAAAVKADQAKLAKILEKAKRRGRN